jgi:7-carboxy-7-deazaguanine synthase
MAMKPVSEPTLRVSEIYASILGESTYAGWPGVIVRLVGCPLRCTWCDTRHAYEGGEPMTLAAIVDRVMHHGIPLVLLTGGEPLAQVGARYLIGLLLARGFRVLIETGGGVSIEGVDPRATIVLDVKCPSSGMNERQVWQNLDWLKPNDEVKFVIATRKDYEWARDLLKQSGMASRNVVHFSPVELAEARGAGGAANGDAPSGKAAAASPAASAKPGPALGVSKQELAAWILADRLPVRLNLQQHVWIWGRGVRGV